MLAALAQKSRIELLPRPEGNRVLLDGDDVTERIRRQDVTEAASKVSVHPPVREWMVAQQRDMGAGGGIVMEGRDIGTKVFPDAEVKIFLDAAPEIRGTRRFHGESCFRGSMLQRPLGGGRVARARPARPHPRQLTPCGRAGRGAD